MSDPRLKVLVAHHVSEMSLSKHRLRGKRAPPAAHVLPEPALQAIADDSWCELQSLSDDARRKHIHWIMVRTHNNQHVQPQDLNQPPQQVSFNLHVILATWHPPHPPPKKGIDRRIRGPRPPCPPIPMLKHICSSDGPSISYRPIVSTL